jgi:hypothetical protein
MFESAPTIIVGNPPFEESRKAGVRAQKAADILRLYMDWLPDNGLLGVVLPLTFIQNASASDARRILLEQFDVQELWELPAGAIPGSGVETAVVLARKHPKSSFRDSHLATRVQKFANAEAGGNRSVRPTTCITYLAAQHAWLQRPRHLMTSSPLDLLWERLSAQFRAAEPNACRIRNGIQAVGNEQREEHFSTVAQGREWRPLLHDNENGETLAPFRINWAGQDIKFVKYPSPRLHRARTPSHFDAAPKVVLNATRNGRSHWRIYGAVDRQGYVVTENFHYVLPRDGVPAELLAAVFNSSLANAWFSSRNIQRDINLGQLRILPFPEDIRNPVVAQLVSLVRKVEAEGTTSRSLHTGAVYLRKMDELVFDWYGLSSREREIIRDWMRGFIRPGVSTLDEPQLGSQEVDSTEISGAYASTHRWLAPGHVEAVDALRGTVRLWISGWAEPADIPVPATMPGWALRDESAFIAEIPWSQRNLDRPAEIDWLEFRPLGYSYLSDVEIIERLQG